MTIKSAANHASDFPPSHWAPRKSFLSPIPELEEVADLLNEAVDAMLSEKMSTAKLLIVEADMAVVGEYVGRIIGPVSTAIHRYRDVGDPPANRARVKQRMPTAAVEREIYARDGWRCRICGTRVIMKNAVKKMHALFPNEARWGRKNIDRHHGISALCVSLDHLLPHSRGGTNEPDNLVTTCGPCQFGRGNWTLAEVGITDPRDRAPVVDQWDGLTRLARLRT